MNIDFSSLAPLASAVEQAGAPILAGALRAGSTVATAAPFPLNLVLPTVLNGLATAVGGNAADPSTITSQINPNDPTAVAKIQAIEDQHRADLQNAVDMAKLQTDQSALNPAAPAWLNLIIAGWRPAYAWSIVIWANVLLVRAFLGYSEGAGFLSMWGPIWATFGLMLGLRTVEKWGGVSSPMAVLPPVVRRIIKRR